MPVNRFWKSTVLGLPFALLLSVAAQAQQGADPIRNITPVTDEMLRNPPAADPSAAQMLSTVLCHLAEVLRQRQALAEARPLAEEALALSQRHPEWPKDELQRAVRNLEAILGDLGDWTGLEAIHVEQLRDLRARSPADDGTLAGLLSRFSTTLLTERKFSEAEPLARECLAIHERKWPDDPLTFSTRSLVGATLLGQKKYVEAEPLLLSGYEGMHQREARIPSQGKPHFRKALERLVRFYEATGKSDQAAEWKKKLEEFDKGHANNL